MCLSFFYPLFWGSQLVVAAAPLVIGVVFKSGRITGAEINYFSVFLVSTGQTQPPILVTLAVIITTGAILALALGRFVVLSWLCLALPAYLACSQMILDAVFVPYQLHPADWLALFGSFSVTVAGLRLAVRSLEPTGYWTRLGSLAASFLAPVTLLFSAILLQPGVTIWVGRPIPPTLAVLLHCLLACVAAGLAALARPRPGRVPAPLQWKSVAWGIAAVPASNWVRAALDSPLRRFFHRGKFSSASGWSSE